MAVSAVGLKTHIWNNNLKSLLFLLCYPLLITATYMALVAAILVGVMIEFDSQLEPNDLPPLFYTFALDYWYIPYGLTLGFLSMMYLYHRNRLDVGVGMKRITRETHPQLFTFLENLCISRGFTMPYFFVHYHRSCNAYTTGLSPHTYRIVVTSGLVETLTPEELECVLAHELTHLLNGDTRLVFITSTISHIFRTLSEMVSSISYYTDELPINKKLEDRSPNIHHSLVLLPLRLVLKLANIGAVLAQLFISRKREYIADAGAIELTKNPHAMIAALKKVEASSSEGYESALRPSLFHSHWKKMSTHPSIRDRIAAIRYYNRIESDYESPWKKSTLKKAVIAEKDVVW